MNSTRTSTALAAAAVAAAAIGMPSAHAAADDLAFGGSIAVVAGSVVVTATVPTSDVPVYVSRSFEYDVYGTCFTRQGRAVAAFEERVGGARVPFGPGQFQLRVPPSQQTAFTFGDGIDLLIHPPPFGTLGEVDCPRGLTPGLHRLNVTDFGVTASYSGPQGVRTAGGPVDLDHYFAGAPKSKRTSGSS